MRGNLIERYILSAIIPYFLLTAVLLTAVLVTQQSAKFVEVLGAGGRAPWYWAVEIMLAVLPNVLIFTLPMAMLVGTATGLSRIGSDGELTAMLATGMGQLRMLAPVMIFAFLLSLVTLDIGFELAPPAARKLRDVTSQAALYRLESPVEPRSFNTELPGKVIYVRDGDEAEGVWEGVFIQWEEKNYLRLITATSGHIDNSGDQAELVLNEATITTIPREIFTTSGLQHMTSEKSAQFRVRDDRINETRNLILKKVRERQPELDEMNLRQLWNSAEAQDSNPEKLSIVIALHKRLSLCFAPIAFALLGVSLGNRSGRAGRAFAVGLSLAVMIIYYLISLAGEQVARTNLFNPVVCVWASFILSLFTGLIIISGRQISIKHRIWGGRERARTLLLHRDGRGHRFRFLVLIDWMILRSLLIYFTYAFLVMLFIFMIFTFFELFRFVVLNTSNLSLLFRYTIYLLPFVMVTIAPLATLISVLVTFVIFVKRSEITAWWASGESIYRLLVPVIAFAIGIGFIQFLVQENVLPYSNQRQNALRSQIRNGPSHSRGLTGQQWIANSELKRIYAFNFDERESKLDNIFIYQFDSQGTDLTSILFGERGRWIDGSSIEIQTPSIIELREGTTPLLRYEPDYILTRVERSLLDKPSLKNPMEVSSHDLSKYINSLKSTGDDSKLQILATALERKRSDPFAPLVMACIGVPLGLAFGRRGLLTPLFVAVLVGLMFWAITSGMQQLGYNGYLNPRLAAWGPPLAFVLVGAFILFKSRT